MEPRRKWPKIIGFAGFCSPWHKSCWWFQIFWFSPGTLGKWCKSTSAYFSQGLVQPPPTSGVMRPYENHWFSGFPDRIWSPWSDFFGTGDLLCGDPQASFHSGFSPPKGVGWYWCWSEKVYTKYKIDIENTCGLRFFLQGCLVGGVQYVIH